MFRLKSVPGVSFALLVLLAAMVLLVPALSSQDPLAIGDVLALHCPRSDDDKNELPDRVITL